MVSIPSRSVIICIRSRLECIALDAEVYFKFAAEHNYYTKKKWAVEDSNLSGIAIINPLNLFQLYYLVSRHSPADAPAHLTKNFPVEFFILSSFRV